MTAPRPNPVPPAPALPARAAFWFVLVLGLWRGAPLVAESLPGGYAFFEPVVEGQQLAIAWLAEKATGIRIEHFPAGSGDTTYNWIELAAQLAACAALAFVAAAFDETGGASPRRRYALQGVLRLGLAAGMLLYGFAKVFPSQFAPLTLDRFATPIGDASPMGLLWALLRHSRPYQIFGGLAEVACGLLLLPRRTTTLGALGSTAVLANVAALNFCYDVPVKLFSAQLLATALLLAAPELPALLRIAVLRRGDALAPLDEPFPSSRGRALRVAIELAIGAALLAGSILAATFDDAEAMAAFATPPEMVGLYEVEPIDEATPAPTGWRRLAIGEFGSASLLTGDLRARHMKLRVAEDRAALSLFFSDDESASARVARLDGEGLLVEGDSPRGSFRARLRRLPTPAFLLATRGFHLVTEQTFNR